MSPIYRSRRAARVLVPCLLFPLSGACHKDEGPERLARAEAKYAEWVERGVRPDDPAWDGVIAELEAVPTLEELRSTRPMGARSPWTSTAIQRDNARPCPFPRQATRPPISS